MRKVMLLLSVLCLAGSLWAADLTLGTWKLNLEKSKIPPNSLLAKGAVVVIRAIGDHNELVFTFNQTGGSTETQTYTYPQTGGILQSAALSKDIMAIVTVIGPGEFYETAIQDGKQVMWQHGLVSKDGRTLTETQQRVDAEGKRIEILKVWEKQ